MAKTVKHAPVIKGKVERIPRPVTLFNDVDRMFEEFLARPWLPRLWGDRPELAVPLFPPVDIVDRAEEVVVRAHVPGYKKEDLEISVSNSTLTLKGETHLQKEEKGDFYRCELSHGAFARTFRLPAEVDDAKASATVKDGVLELTLPKREKAKRHTITIN